MTPRPVVESRLAVGSSARISAGAVTIARAMATRCCCPPLSSPGRRSARSPSPTSSRMRQHLLPALPGGQPLEEQHVVDVLEGRQDGDEIVLLENQPDGAQAQAGRRPTGEAVGRPAGQGDRPGGRGVDEAHQVEEGGFPGARRTRQADEFPGTDGEGDGVQRRHRHALVPRVDATHLVQIEQHRILLRHDAPPGPAPAAPPSRRDRGPQPAPWPA